MFNVYKFRIYPTKQQEALLIKHFNACRFVYNLSLEKKIKAYTERNEKISCFKLITDLTKLKKQEDFSWLNEVSAQALQASVSCLDTAFTNFFKNKKGFPKFKKKGVDKDSFQNPQGTQINFNENKIQIYKFKEGIKIRFDKRKQILEGLLEKGSEVKTCTISRNNVNQYFISILLEIDKEPLIKKEIKKETSIGIDLGIKDFAILSTGEKIPNPKHLKDNEKKLKKLQRRVSRKQKNSKRRVKAKIKLAKHHLKIANRREDFLHKTSFSLVKRFNTLCVEDLNVQGMLKKHKLAKAISDCSCSKFLNMLLYKTEKEGKNLLFIGRFDPSSKLCSSCGTVKKDLKLSDRNWKCEACKAEHDRDVNAAKNILNFALQRQNLEYHQRIAG
jgi:putative transposase